MTDPTASFFAALDEWGRWLVLLHTCDPAAGAERAHRERMLRQCRTNMELAMRHLMTEASGPSRSTSVHMTAVHVDVEQRDEDEEKR